MYNRHERYSEFLIQMAFFFIEDETATVRSVGKEFDVSKSTAYKYFTGNLKYVSPILYKKVMRKLKKNKDERYRRGGLAVQRKNRLARQIRE